MATESAEARGKARAVELGIAITPSAETPFKALKLAMVAEGAFWEEIASMGGPPRTVDESVDAHAEAIAVIRAVWSGGRRCAPAERGTGSAAHTQGPGPSRRAGSGSGWARFSRACGSGDITRPRGKKD